jgi:hypothetical protein
VSRWFWHRNKSASAETAGKLKGARRTAPAADRHKTKNRRADPPAPLTWNDPDQDFITRYGDPFDG